MASTPPPSSIRELRVPKAPRHGAGYDSFEPYPPRQSARLAAQMSTDTRATTPPPLSPKRSARRHQVETLSPPQTRSPHKQSGHKKALLDDYLSEHSAVSDGSEASSPVGRSSSAVFPARSQLLATPAKTPRHKKSTENTGSIARSLFPASITASRQSKAAQKYSLDSFQEDSSGNSDSIEIYTDSRDRVPVMNNSHSNPFVSKGYQARPRETPKSKRRDLTPDNSEEIDTKEALKRKDGMLYTFRGKKVFRKFDNRVVDEEEAQNELNDLGLFSARTDLLDASVDLDARPLTRSAIKGRRLIFTTAEAKQPDSVDENEEATTDIEEPVKSVESADIVHSDGELETTPKKRTLRNRSTRLRHDHQAEAVHQAVADTKKRDKRGSPFDVWTRLKPAKGPTSKKREADPFTSTPEPVAKRTRGH